MIARLPNFLILISILMLIISIPANAVFPNYAVVDLGTLNGTSSFATGISQNGHVSADYHTSSGGSGTFVWYNNAITDLGSPFGTAGSSTSVGVNDNGSVAGKGLVGNHIHGFIYRNGTATDIGTLGDTFTEVQGITNGDYVVGNSQTKEGITVPAVWTEGLLSTLSDEEASTFIAINDRGQVVTGDNIYLPYPAYGLKAGVMNDLGTLPGGTGVRACAISKTGYVVGDGNSTTRSEVAFLWKRILNGTIWTSSFTELGVLPGATDSSATGVNSSGQVVGRSGDYRGHDHFFWQAGDGIINLNSLINTNSSQWLLTDVAGINDQGWIAATARNSIGSEHAVLLVPVTGPQNVSLTPDSGTLGIETRLTLKAVYSDPSGWPNLDNCYLMVNTTANPDKAAYFRYNVTRNKLYTYGGNDSWMGGLAPGTVGKTVANGYGRLYCEFTSVTKSDNIVTINWVIALKSPYSSLSHCNAYMRVINMQGTQSGWQQMGAYTIMHSNTSQALINIEDAVPYPNTPSDIQEYDAEK